MKEGFFFWKLITKTGKTKTRNLAHRFFGLLSCQVLLEQVGKREDCRKIFLERLFSLSKVLSEKHANLVCLFEGYRLLLFDCRTDFLENNWIRAKRLSLELTKARFYIKRVFEQLSKGNLCDFLL